MSYPFSSYLTALFLLFSTAFATAQRPGGDAPAPVRVSGKIVDGQSKQPLEFATVTLFNQADSALVTGGITDENGEIALEVQPGNFWASVEFLSYKSKIINDLSVSKNDATLDLGTILLDTDAKMLSQVEVTAEKSQMQLSLDKRVFNVGKDLANKGGTAADILDNVPSVTVDVEGNVELRGSGNVRILIDGKPSGLLSGSGGNGLRQLPANMIDRIEVITNPSARYEAEGMSGIINIILKKDQQQGLKGSFDLTGGLPEEYGAAVNFNYRKNRLNFFTTYGLRYNKAPGRGSQYQEFYDNDTTFITDQISRRKRGGWSNNVRFGADYFFNEKNILTTAFNYNHSNEDNFSTLTYRDYIFDLNNLDSSTVRTDKEKELENNLEYALTYRKTFDQQGREFTVDVRYQDNSEKENSDFLETYFDKNGTRTSTPDYLQRSGNAEGERNIILQADYVHPLSKDDKFELGYRSGLRRIKNDYLVEEFADGAWQNLAGLSNNFVYTENIHAAYGTFGKKINRFSVQGGLRFEVSDVKTELLQTQEINDRYYTNLFPSAHVNYELSEGNALQVSYSRRINRPRFWDLNPFFTFSDNRNFFSGNPNLDPEFTNSYEIGHLKYWEKASLTSSIYYRHTNDVIERIRTVDSEGNTNTRPQNLATQDNYGLEFTWSYDPFKALRLNGNLNFFRSITEGESLGQTFNADAYTWFGRLSSRVTVFKKLDLQTTFNYRAPRVSTQGKNKAMYHLDLGASTDILKGNGTLTLSGRDLLNSRRRRYINEGDNFFLEGDWQWRGRSVNLTFSYRINQQKQRDKEGRGGGMEGGDGGGDF